MKHRHYALDGTRGLCAIAIAIFHFCSWSKIAEYSSVGLYGVYVFFILSALTLCIVYGETFTTQIALADLRKYWISRIARIFPLLIAVAAGSLALAIYAGAAPLRQILKFFLTGTGLFALQAPGSSANATGTWSLGIEILFYVVFPIACLLANNATRKTVFGATLVGLLAQIVSNTLVLRTPWAAPHWSLYVLPISFTFYFASGFLIYRSRIEPTIQNLFTGLAVIMAVLCISCVKSFTDSELLAFPLGLVLPVFMALGVFLIFNSKTPEWLVAPFEFLGAISYSAYLLHPFAYLFAAKAARVFGLPGLALRGLLFAAITVALSYASYRLWEMPMRLWIRRAEGVPMPKTEIPSLTLAEENAIS